MHLLFTTPSCHQCPRAKSFLLERKIEVTIIDASKPEGLKKAVNYGLNSVPSIVEVDQEQRAMRTVSGLEKILKAF